MMQEDDVQALRIAVETLEHPRLAARLAEIAGKPVVIFNRTLSELLPSQAPGAQLAEATTPLPLVCAG